MAVPVVRPRSLVGVLAALAILSSAARAEPGREKRRALPLVLSVVPGALVHGAGHFAAGERRVARRLLAMEGVGLGLIAAGGAPLILTGASRHYSGPPIALLVSGVGLFAMSWLADLYGVARGGGAAGEVSADAPVEIETGYAYVYDPQFEYRQFATVAAGASFGPNRLRPSAWIALDEDNQRLRLEAARRFVGAGSARPTGDASTLELVAAATHHRYPGEAFAVTTGELSVGGRFDMERLGDSLTGSFAELWLGLGAELTNYYRPGAGADLSQLLLARFAYGMRFGRPGRPAGEASLYYDHRRDTLTGGLSPGAGPGSGFAGFFGADLLLLVSPRWGVRAQFEQGAARTAHLGLVMRLRDAPW